MPKLRDDLELTFRTWPHGRADSTMNKRNLIAWFDSFFTNTWDRFRSGWRPDCPDMEASIVPGGKVNRMAAKMAKANMQQSLRQQQKWIQQQHFHCWIRYTWKVDQSNGAGRLCFASFAIKVTVPALLTLTKHSQRLLEPPVGEIGKQLQEATSNSNLSSITRRSLVGSRGS